MTTPDVNDTPPQGDPPDDPAGQTDPTSTDVEETPDSEPPDDDQDDAPKGNREQRYRARAQRAEAEVATLQARVDGLIGGVIANHVREAGYPDSMTGLLDTASLLDTDGHLDDAKVAEAITAAATRFNIARKAKPVPGQGVSGPASSAPSWSDVISRKIPS